MVLAKLRKKKKEYGEREGRIIGVLGEPGGLTPRGSIRTSRGESPLEIGGMQVGGVIKGHPRRTSILEEAI